MAGEQILVVDDNPANLKLAKVLLVTEGYKVRTAKDAREALEVLGSFNPRLILMDIQMPGMDGLELTRRLKADAETSDILILAMTAFAMKGDEQKAKDAGCDGYLTKPIDTRALPKILEQWLRSGGKMSAESAVVLVVDDDERIRKLFRLALELEGHTVVEAGDGATAVAMAKQHRPQLILQDLVLPDVDGFVLVGKLRSVSGALVIAVSGLLGGLDEARIAAAGFADFVVKPVGLAVLRDRVRLHLGVGTSCGA